MARAIEGVHVALRAHAAELPLAEQRRFPELETAPWSPWAASAALPLDRLDVLEFFPDEVRATPDGHVLARSCASTLRARREVKAFLNKHAPRGASLVERLRDWLCRPFRRGPPIPFHYGCLSQTSKH